MDNISDAPVAYHGVGQTNDKYMIIQPRLQIRPPEYDVDGKRTDAARKPQVYQ